MLERGTKEDVVKADADDAAASARREVKKFIVIFSCICTAMTEARKLWQRLPSLDCCSALRDDDLALGDDTAFERAVVSQKARQASATRHTSP